MSEPLNLDIVGQSNEMYYIDRGRTEQGLVKISDHIKGDLLDISRKSTCLRKKQLVCTCYLPLFSYIHTFFSRIILVVVTPVVIEFLVNYQLKSQIK